MPVLAGEVVDGTFMNVAALRRFLTEQIARAKAEDVLFSVHLKATMMKVSDPIIFGHAVQAFFPTLFEQYGEQLAAAGISPNDGLGALLSAIAGLPEGEAIAKAVEQGLADGPAMAMVDSDKGITNLHVPSDVIIDASMPAMIRSSGHMWGPDGEEHDTLAVIPDSSYAGIYQTVLDDCRAHGAFDPATMGSVPNVGLMAKAAEEYGSHDKTFEVPTAGVVRVVNGAGEALIEHTVEPGDIWRACQTKDEPIRDWVKLAVTRARATGAPAVFWLDESRAHDANLIAKVNEYLPDHDTDGLTIEIMAPAEATAYSLERIRRGEDTISVTGNVLRDYNTDLFPILELGTSRQDALGRPADERRRAVRDRRRWLGAQARAAAGQGELPALGQPRRVLRTGGVASSTWPTTPTTRGRRSSPTPSTARPARSSRTTSRRPARSAASTTAARTSTWRSTGPRSWPNQDQDADLAASFKPFAETLAGAGGARSSTSCSRCRAARRTSAATTALTREGGGGHAPVEDVQRGAGLALVSDTEALRTPLAPRTSSGGR